MNCNKILLGVGLYDNNFILITKTCVKVQTNYTHVDNLFYKF